MRIIISESTGLGVPFKKYMFYSIQSMISSTGLIFNYRAYLLPDVVLVQTVDAFFVMDEFEPLLKVCLQVLVAAENIAPFHSS